MIPSRRLVTLYALTARLSLALAFWLVAWNPRAVAGFFYHSWIVAIVHLVTIGWIGLSILGNLYVVLPEAFGVPFPARKADYTAYAFVTIGLIGMVAHFWIAEFGGMAWSAAMAAAGIAYVMGRLVRAVRAADVAGGVKLHVYCACANILVAASFGVLIGFDKVHHFLPGYVLANVFAHAHLAAIGWASMMIVGFAYQLLPRILGSRFPSGVTVYVSAILLETGVLGLFFSLLLQNDATVFFAAVIAAGFAAFGAHVIRMVVGSRRRVSMHIAAAGGWLALATVCGLMLAAWPTSESTLRMALGYGVFGLVGFLAQALVGLEQSRREADSWVDGAAYYGWLAGVPTLAGGFLFNVPEVLAAGAASLLAATLVRSLHGGTSLATQHPACDPSA